LTDYKTKMQSAEAMDKQNAQAFHEKQLELVLISKPKQELVAMIPRPDANLERNEVLIELRNAISELDEIKNKKAKIIEEA